MSRNRDPFETAIAALNRRAYSVAAMRDRLLARGFDEEAIADAIERLIEIGALDDQRYAELFAADKRDLSGWGGERIAAALRGQGISAALIERVCDESRDEQVSRATETLNRRGLSVDDDSERNRALGFLTRRGYAYETAYEAIRAAGRD